LLQSAAYSQFIECKSDEWWFAEFTDNGALKSEPIINDSAIFFFESYSPNNPHNVFIIDLYKNGRRTYMVFGDIIQKSEFTKNTYIIKFSGYSDIIVYEADFAGKIGQLNFSKEIILISYENFSIALLNYRTKISIE